MSGPSPGWYLRRLRRMPPAELWWRSADQLRRVTWVRRQVRPGEPAIAPLPLVPVRGFAARVSPELVAELPEPARQAVVDAANRILEGRWEVLGAERTDLAAPDWFTDPLTGRRSDPARYAFRVNHRSESETGNVKQVWELSRQHHLTVLAAAWFLTKDEAYAERVAEQLRSWWRANPYLSGVHWTNGIELGIRLIGWAWIRRLLDGWPRVAELFDGSDLALRQLYWHQRYLAAFRSRGSSANNHVVAEAAGRLVAACAFPWYAESARWRRRAARVLERELARNTFDDGLDREQASDYHAFVAELGLLAAVEAEAAGHPLGQATWQRLAAMLDAAAAVVDRRGRPPRQGDGDEGRALVLDPAEPGRWSWLFALGGALVGPAPWWPPAAAEASPGAASLLAGALVGDAARSRIGPRPGRRPAHFAGAGLTLLRTLDEAPEIWCRCDGGPHGFLSIAAHAHADALSLEVRVDGVDVLADPGTYCYHGEPQWREYFRSTGAHNTVELAGRSQSVSGGPFLWLRHAATRVLTADVDDDSEVVTWSAEHDGYAGLDPPGRHRRTVRLDRRRRLLDVVDDLAGAGHLLRVTYHTGPAVQVELAGSRARLTWTARDGSPGSAVVELPDGLHWASGRGQADPVLGWYSPRFGQKVAVTALVGTGRIGPDCTLHTRFDFGTG